MPAVGDLRAHLQSKLPDYMVPAAFIALDRLPLNANGKLDRRALPAPESARPGFDSRFVAPRTPAECTLAAIWQRVLGLERVGVNDNFYELGGHSLHMIQVHARLRAALSSDISVVRMFQHPTIESLARHLESGQPAGALPAGIAARAGRQKAALARQRLITRKP